MTSLRFSFFNKTKVGRYISVKMSTSVQSNSFSTDHLPTQQAEQLDRDPADMLTLTFHVLRVSYLLEKHPTV